MSKKDQVSVEFYFPESKWLELQNHPDLKKERLHELNLHDIGWVQNVNLPRCTPAIHLATRLVTFVPRWIEGIELFKEMLLWQRKQRGCRPSKRQTNKQTNKQKPREVVNKKNTGFLCFFLGDEVLLGGGFKHLFSPLLGEMIPFLTYISQMGWNRQLDKNTWDIYLCVPGNGWIFLNAKINSVAVFWKVRIDVE